VARITAITIIYLVVAAGSFCAVAADNADMNDHDAAVGDSNSGGVVIIQEDSYGPGFCGCDFSGNGAINFLDLAALGPWWDYDDDCWINNDWCEKADLNHDTDVNYEDLLIIVECWLDEDMSAPTPNPMQWDRSLDEGGFDGKPREYYIGPNPTFDWGAAMRADPNTADDTGFEFYFDCTNYSGYDSGWISFPEGLPYEYTVYIGQQGFPMQWRVRARDCSVNQDINVTGWSSLELLN